MDKTLYIFILLLVTREKTFYNEMIIFLQKKNKLETKISGHIFIYGIIYFLFFIPII